MLTLMAVPGEMFSQRPGVSTVACALWQCLMLPVVSV